MTPTAAADLYHASVLWAIGETGVAPVVLAACDALVAGLDGEALQELAGLSLKADQYGVEVEEAIQRALNELGMSLPERGTPEVQAEAVRAMAREALAGRWVPRELAAWAHRAIGHAGVAMAQPLVDLDDRYDTADYTGEAVESVDRAVFDFCRSVTGD